MCVKGYAKLKCTNASELGLTYFLGKLCSSGAGQGETFRLWDGTYKSFFWVTSWVRTNLAQNSLR